MAERAAPPRVTVDPMEVTVTPGGGPSTLAVRITNASSVVDEFVVWLRSGEGWLEASSSKVRLLPRTDEVVEVTVGVRDGELPHAGAWPVALTVRATSSGASASVQVQIVVPAVVGDTSLWLEPEVARGTKSADLTAVVRHSGNTPVRLHLTARGAEEGLAFTIDPAVLDVAPRSLGRAAIVVQARRPLHGHEQHRTFTLTAAGEHRSLQMPGTFLQRPMVPRASTLTIRPVLRVALTVAGGAGLVLSGLAPWTSDPVRGTDWTVAAFATAFGATLRTDFPTALSAGAVSAVLGVLAIIGLLGRDGRLTRMSAIAAGVGVTAFAVVVRIVAPALSGNTTDRSLRLGLLAVAVSAVVAYVGGGLARAPTR